SVFRTALAVALGGSLAAISFAQSSPPAHVPVLASAIACDADNGGLVLPKGFCAIVVARDVGIARHMAVRPNGDLYVAIDNDTANGITGHVLALRDIDNDGRPDVMATFGPDGGNGIAWWDGHLFFSPADRVLRFDFAGDELVPSAPPVTLVS